MMTVKSLPRLYVLAATFFLVFVSACAAHQTPIERDSPITENLSLPLDWYPALDAAVKDFVASERPAAGCFTVSAQVGAETLRVNFFPRRGLGDENLRGGLTSCGRAVSYDMAINGGVVRKSFWR